MARLPAVGVAVVAALVGALLLPVWPVLRVSHGEEVVADLRDDRITVSYVHSIDQLPIEEDLRVHDGHLVVERTRLRQFGAGMGQIDDEGRGYADGSWWVVDDLHRDIGPQMLLRVGAPRVDHRLRADGTEVALSSCLAGERVRVAPARVSTLALLQDDQPKCEPSSTAESER